MDLIKHTTQWVNGEILQGRIGFGIGILIAIAFLYLSNFHQSFYKGMSLIFGIFLIVAYTFDTRLHLRLRAYLSAMQDLN